MTVAVSLPMVQTAGSAGSTGLLSRYIGVSGGGDRLDDGFFDRRI
jgi:hypothetical protein